nr:hypothetical protein [Tanacetum cinerariifolium]GEY97700.1 hypothetical protein [Tanacetum cinerariifolium]
MLWKLTQEAIVWALNLHIRCIAPTQVLLNILSFYLGRLILVEMIPRAQVNLNQNRHLLLLYNLLEDHGSVGTGCYLILEKYFLWRFNGRDWKLKRCSNGSERYNLFRSR